MAKSFLEQVAEAQKAVPTISPADAKAAIDADGNTLIIDVRDGSEIAESGKAPGTAEISLGTLPYKADHEMPEGVRDARLEDKGRPILCMCAKGGQASLGAKLLKDYGFTNVKIIEGGIEGWKNAGLPTE
jgi:rhodanese-related sulfurtransferase